MDLSNRQILDMVYASGDRMVTRMERTELPSEGHRMTITTLTDREVSELISALETRLKESPVARVLHEEFEAMMHAIKEE